MKNEVIEMDEVKTEIVDVKPAKEIHIGPFYLGVQKKAKPEETEQPKPKKHIGRKILVGAAAVTAGAVLVGKAILNAAGKKDQPEDSELELPEDDFSVEPDLDQTEITDETSTEVNAEE